MTLPRGELTGFMWFMVFLYKAQLLIRVLNDENWFLFIFEERVKVIKK